MAKQVLPIRLETEVIDQIKKVSPEGNVSMWVRLLIQKELGKMNMKLTRNGQDVARGYENLYSMESCVDGKWKVLNTWNRDHGCTNILCEFWLLENIDTKEVMLLGSGANMGHSIGKKIKISTAESMSMDDMLEYLQD